VQRSFFSATRHDLSVRRSDYAQSLTANVACAGISVKAMGALCVLLPAGLTILQRKLFASGSAVAKPAPAGPISLAKTRLSAGMVDAFAGRTYWR
jgi:hypothetical protein